MKYEPFYKFHRGLERHVKKFPLFKKNLLVSNNHPTQSLKLFSPVDSSYENPVKDREGWTADKILQCLEIALKFNRVEIFAQPLVFIPSRQIWAMEFFGRIRAKPGVYIPASQYANLAAEKNLLKELDNKVLMKSLEILNLEARKQAGKGSLKPFFLNIGAHTLTDTEFMHLLLQFLSRYKHLASLIVLEIREEELLGFNESVLEIINGLSQIGCRVSLDNFKSGNINMELVERCNIQYIKIKSSILTRLLNHKAHKIKELNEKIRLLQEKNIEIIADKIETKEALNQILDLPVFRAQGYLLGKPESPGVYNIRIAA